MKSRFLARSLLPAVSLLGEVPASPAATPNVTTALPLEIIRPQL